MNTESGGDTADCLGHGFADESGHHLRILEAMLFAADEPMAVSYTHLTLPTICSV